jgi:NADH:ubiquinone oxidoreductase subunit E
MLAGSMESILDGRRSQPHQLVEVLQDVQKEKGYLSKKSMTVVSRELGVPFIDVYRVAKFYKAFCLVPRGKNVMTVCVGTACHVRGADPLLNQMLTQLDVEKGETTGDGLFTVECVNCLGACALGPVVVVNDDYNNHMTPAKIRARIKSISKSEQKGKKDA